MNINSDWLSKQLSLPPFRSFLRLNFRRVVSYILILKDTNGTTSGQTSTGSDVQNDVDCLIDELRTSFDTVCDQDYYEFVKLCDRNKHLAKADLVTRKLAKDIGCSFILNWALIETAKYCLVQKLAPENSTTNQFLTLLRDELRRPFRLDSQPNRLALLRFIQYLDKFILDRTSDSSHRRHTLSVAENVEHFIDANRDILRTWFLNYRQVTARLALVIGDSTECWRNMSHRLWNDMATKYYTSDLQQQSNGSIGLSSTKISVSQTLMSLDTKQWRSNLELFALCAKELDDIDLLYGVESLVNFGGLLGEKWDLVSLITSNMESNFSNTYQNFLNLIRESDADPTKIDQLSLIEFLNSCIELDKLDVQSDKIALLHSSNFKFLYEQYLESKAAVSSHDLAKSRFTQVKKWISSWSFEPDAIASPPETINAYRELAIPTLIINASRIECEASVRNSMIEDIRNLIESEATGKFLIDSDGHRDSTETFKDFLMLIVDDKLAAGSSDLVLRTSGFKYRPGRQHHLFHRLLDGARLVSNFDNHINRENIDLVQLEAVKFNLKSGNTEYALNLATNLDTRNTDDWVKYSNKLILLEANNSDNGFVSFRNLAEVISSSKNLDECRRNRLLSKVLDRAWRTTPKSLENLSELLESIFFESDERSYQKLAEDSICHISKIEQIIGKQDLPIKTLVIIAHTLNSSDLGSSLNLLNTSFKVDMMLLSRINGAEFLQGKRNLIIETAARILDRIKKYGSRLDTCNLVTFSSQAFIDNTIDNVWFGLKSSIISLITSCQELPLVWADALTLIIKRIAATKPEAILFETIVNRLDLQGKLVDSDTRMSPSHHHRLSEPSILLQHDTGALNDQKSADSLQPENCRCQLNFWDKIYKAINDSNDDKSDGWSGKLLETEAFLREIRKISYLPGEYLKSLTTRMNRRLHQYLNLFKKYANPKTGLIVDQKHLDECRARLNSIYRHDSKSIEVLKAYLERSQTRSQVTIYDSSLSSGLCGPLRELDYRFKLLATRRTPTVGQLETLIKSITELLSLCRTKVMVIHHAFKQKLYMEQISPFLSRLKSDLVLMPGYFMEGAGDSQCSPNFPDKRQVPITIHKISQSVQMIHSKTAPKKLIFIGSDGRSRSYLLKAHEDLRLDKLIMELFGSINLLLEGSKKTRDYKYKLQRYSVTPVCTRSGLLQWIEAPSLCSFYRSWFQSTNGRRIVGSLYKETCAILCPNQAETDEARHNCIPPVANQIIDPFYQLLWAKIRSIPRRMGLQASKYDQVARPSSETTLKYRKEFPASVYEEVLERLVSVLPQELISNQLWFDSPHSMGYYLRTREFIRSCATISMVGYIIGLGDRHPDNILLDSRTGQVTHIDYNICFEIGRRLSIAEKVPFRLTPSMIRAFGFAGLEGGFKRSCERILDLMKEFKYIILHHLDPINLSFMIGGGEGGPVDEAPSNDLVKVAGSGGLQAQVPSDIATKSTAEGVLRRAASDLTSVGKRPLARRAPEMNLCSQEEDGSATSLELTATIHDNRPPSELAARPPKSSSALKMSHDQESTAGQFSSNQIQFDIKTPTMISSKHANNIYERVQSKLSGNDELLLSNMYASRAETGDARVASVKGSCVGTQDKSQPSTAPTSNEDLILLIDEVQSTEDQVSSLILEAISNKNKAAMFEGWSPWI